MNVTLALTTIVNGYNSAVIRSVLCIVFTLVYSTKFDKLVYTKWISDVINWCTNQNPTMKK